MCYEKTLWAPPSLFLELRHQFFVWFRSANVRCEQSFIRAKGANVCCFRWSERSPGVSNAGVTNVVTALVAPRSSASSIGAVCPLHRSVERKDQTFNQKRSYCVRWSECSPGVSNGGDTNVDSALVAPRSSASSIGAVCPLHHSVKSPRLSKICHHDYRLSHKPYR